MSDNRLPVAELMKGSTGTTDAVSPAPAPGVQAALQDRLGEATGSAQRLAHLHAVMAVNRARHDRNRQATARDSETANRLREELRHRAARWGGEVPWQHSREALPQALADALVLRAEDDRSREMVDQIVEYYRSEWGVIIDPDALTVDIDPQFDPAPAQQFDEAAAVWHRESAALDIVSAASLTAAAKDAAMRTLTNWIGSWSTEGGPHTYVDTQEQRREQLRHDLAVAHLSDADRQHIEFIVDYLRGDLAGVDLLDTPTLVDPGEEVRGRIPQLLQAFAEQLLSPKEMAAEISPMTAADQHAVREVGRAIVAGHNPNLQVWPNYVDRDQVLDQLRAYANDAYDQHLDADRIVENRDVPGRDPDMVGVDDDAQARLDRMTDRRAQLNAIAADPSPNGLISVERAQLAATLADIDAGRIRGEGQLPELMWADDRTRAIVDGTRRHKVAEHLAHATSRSINEMVAETGRVAPDSRKAIDMSQALGALDGTIYRVAVGPRKEGLDKLRHAYSDAVEELGTRLAQAGIDRDTTQRIRGLVDHAARHAGQLGREADDRKQRWAARTDRAVAARNDANAQRAAAAAGHARRQSRHCTTRTDRAAQGPTRAAGRRQLHSPEVGR